MKLTENQPPLQVPDLQAEARKVAHKVLREMNGSTSSSTSGAATPTPSPTPPLQTPDGHTTMQPPSRERTFELDGSSDGRSGPTSKFPVRQKSAVNTGVSKQSQHDEELSPRSVPGKMNKGGIDERVRAKKKGGKETTEPSIPSKPEGKRNNSVIRIDGAVDGIDGKKGV
jgi:hypothetical protein